MEKRRALNIVLVGLTIGASYTAGAASQTDSRYRIDREDDRVYLVDAKHDERLQLDEARSIADLAHCEDTQHNSIEYRMEGVMDRLMNLYYGLAE